MDPGLKGPIERERKDETKRCDLRPRGESRLARKMEAKLQKRRERKMAERRGVGTDRKERDRNNTTADPDEDETVEVRIKWDSGRKHGANEHETSESVEDGQVKAFRLEGNEYLQVEEPEMAATCYLKALDIAERRGTDTPRGLAKLHSNLAAAYMKMKKFEDAAEHSERAAKLDPEWPKPLYRLAQAQMELGLYRGAMMTCRKGEAVLDAKKDNSREFAPLMDKIAYVAALNGSLAGFDGRILEVRSAGEEAWLGREAPEDPVLDRKKETLAIDAMGLPVKHSENVDNGNGCTEIEERFSFRSLKEAMEAAKDGDRILLLRGIHNGSGRTVKVNKRVLIRGEGAMTETKYDQRANTPTLRITCTSLVQNVDFDMSGFRECILVDGDQTVRPIIEHCSIKCSGDNGIYTCGNSHAVFRHCKIGGRKSGCCAIENSCPALYNCTLSNSGFQALLCMDESHPTLNRCLLSDNEEEGVVVMDDAQVSIFSTEIRGNKGPGIDVSQGGRAVLDDCTVAGNIGGVWIWESGFVNVQNAKINGGKSHAILVDGSGILHAHHTTVDGVVHASEPTWRSLTKGDNQLLEPEHPTELPLEEGCFKFEPDRFTRKQ